MSDVSDREECLTAFLGVSALGYFGMTTAVFFLPNITELEIIINAGTKEIYIY